MDKEAIKEIANQLGKGVDWVTDTLLPYMYKYAEYRVAIDTVWLIVFSTMFLIGIGLLCLGIVRIVKEDLTRYDNDLECLFIGIGVALILIFGACSMLTLDTLLGWIYAPEIQFISSMT